MSRRLPILLFALLAYGLVVNADPPHVEKNINACKQWRYSQKLTELNNRYTECAKDYSELITANPNTGASIASCGNYGAFDQLAQAYADRMCTWGEVYGPQQPGQVLASACEDPLNLGICDGGADPNAGRETGLESSPRPPRRPGADPDPTNQRTATTQDTGSAQYEAQADVNACVSAQSTATRCCGNPQSCAGTLPANDQRNLQQMLQGVNQQPAPGQSLAEYCNQMRSSTQQGSSINNYLSRICYGQMTTCTSTCSGLMQKYQALARNCSGCASQQIYNNAYSQLRSYNESCSGLSARTTTMAAQMGANATSGGYAAACGDMTAASPQGMGMPAPNSASQASLAACQQDPNSAACKNCLMNPSAAGCQATTGANENNTRVGQAGFNSATTEPVGDFNLPDLGDLPTAPMGLPTNNSNGSAAVGKTIPNNSGGGIPGGDGGGPAQLGGKSKSSPGSPGYDTDVLQGTTSGSGFSSQNAQFAAQQGADGRWVAGNSVTRDEHGSLVGVDLKKYLPGGDLDPQRALAGTGKRSQINAREENIWRIISNKFDEKCRLGVLWRCGPEFEK